MRFIAIEPRLSSSTRPRKVAVITPQEWNRMEWKLAEHRVKGEALNAERERENLKKERSRQMTKNWSNTVEQIQLQREQKLNEASRKDEEEKLRINEEIQQKKLKEREEAFERAKRIVYENKDTSRSLISGIMLSAVLEERVRQIELKNQLRRKHKEHEAIEAEQKRKEAANYKEELVKNQLEEIEKKKRNGAMLRDQCAKNEQSRLLLQEERLREKEDNIHNSKEIKEVEEQERMDAMKKKIKLKDEEFQQKKMLRDRQERKKQEELEQNKVNAIYQDVKAKLEQQRKATEAKIRREGHEKRAAIAENSAAQHHEVDPEPSRLKAVQEQELKYQIEQERKAQRKKKLLEELLLLGREAEKDVKAQQIMDKEERRWALLQRLALDKADRELKKCEQHKKSCKQKQLREILVQQWKERLDRDTKGKDNIENWLKAREQERNDLLKYCADAQKFTSEMRWPMYPVSAAIKSVLKSAGIPDDKREVPFLQSKVPIASVEVYE